MLRSILLLLVAWFSSCNQRDASDTPQTDSTQYVWSPFSFQKVDSVNPVMSADEFLRFTCPILKKEILWAEKDVFNPAAIVRHDTLFLLFRAEDKIGKYAGTSRIGLAWSTDGYHFQKYPQPVLYPDNDEYKPLEWEGGCEDPRVVEDSNGRYFMTYTAYDGDKARLMIASSPDLHHWTKHGHAFAKAYGGKYARGWSKSGAVVSDYSEGRIVAKKVKGRYWMLWGDQNIWLASSENLIEWTPILRAEGENTIDNARGIAKEFPELKTVIAPRKKKFDSDLVEPGPPAMFTDSGIVFLYNSRNIRLIGDSGLAEGAYTAGRVLLQKDNPGRVIRRDDVYFMRPEKDYEISGQVNHVCFIEGMVEYRGRWFLYYGTADSKIAVATMK